MQTDVSSKILSNHIKNYDLQLSIHNISMNFAVFCGHFYMGDIRNNDSIIKKINILNYRCKQMSDLIYFVDTFIWELPEIMVRS